MKIDYELLKRFKLFGIGMSMGIVILFFVLNGKKSKCNWFPNQRILNIIRQKQITYSPDINILLGNKKIDSLDISKILLNGKIDFSKSEVKNKPCRKYWINGDVKNQKVVLHVSICDSIATLDGLDF